MRKKFNSFDNVPELMSDNNWVKMFPLNLWISQVFVRKIWSAEFIMKPLFEWKIIKGHLRQATKHNFRFSF